MVLSSEGLEPKEIEAKTRWHFSGLGVVPWPWFAIHLLIIQVLTVPRDAKSKPNRISYLVSSMLLQQQKPHGDDISTIRVTYII